MISNLTEYQLEVAHWLAVQHENGMLAEIFDVRWRSHGVEKIAEIKKFNGMQMTITFAALEILEEEELIRTVDKRFLEPLKLSNARGHQKGESRPFQFNIKKSETGRTYTLRNNIFRANELYERRQLTNAAQRVLEFMIGRSAGMQFATRSELKSVLEMNDRTYDRVCQFLEDFDLIENRSAVGEMWGDIRPTKKGRQAIHEKSLENMLLAQSPIINYNLGDQINVANKGDNATIAAGRHSTITQGLAGDKLEEAFQRIFQKLEQSQYPNPQKVEIKETIELIETEVKKREMVDDKALGYYFRALSKMAPDIVDVVIATAANPIFGVATIVKKVAAKAKADAEGREY